MGGGGAERQLTYLVRAQVQRGHQIHVAICAEGPLFARLVESGATIHRLPGWGTHDPRLIGRLLMLIAEIVPDVVHTRLPQADVVGGSAAMLRGVPWIISERASAAAYPPRAKTRLRVALARGAAAIEANSAAGAHYWRGVRPGTPVRVIPGAVPIAEIDAAVPADLSKLGIAAGTPTILFGGRLEKEKNIPALLHALQYVLRERNAVAIICGTGPLQAELVELATTLGIAEKVRFTGFYPDLWNLMKVADVFVLPSEFEGRPNVVLEAAAARCPLIVSDIAEHREFLDDRSAILVRTSRPVEVADAIRLCLDDREAARGRAVAAAAAVSRFTIERTMAQLDELYEEVVGSRLS
jgi:glycosyltransferase involved in cell wall biosynthesis